MIQISELNTRKQNTSPFVYFKVRIYENARYTNMQCLFFNYSMANSGEIIASPQWIYHISDNTSYSSFLGLNHHKIMTGKSVDQALREMPDAADSLAQLLVMAQTTRGQRNSMGTVSVLATPRQCLELHEALRTKATRVHHQGSAPLMVCTWSTAQIPPFASTGRSPI